LIAECYRSKRSDTVDSDVLQLIAMCCLW